MRGRLRPRAERPSGRLAPSGPTRGAQGGGGLLRPRGLASRPPRGVGCGRRQPAPRPAGGRAAGCPRRRARACRLTATAQSTAAPARCAVSPVSGVCPAGVPPRALLASAKAGRGDEPTEMAQFNKAAPEKQEQYRSLGHAWKKKRKGGGRYNIPPPDILSIRIDSNKFSSFMGHLAEGVQVKSRKYRAYGLEQNFLL